MNYNPLGEENNGKNYATGFLSIKIISTDWQDFLDRCNDAQQKGYYMKSAKYKTLWPFFWKRRYVAKYRKNFVWAGGDDIAFYNPKDIESIQS